MSIDLRLCAERVTGIEPAWPAWKAMALGALLCWSDGYRPRAVPSACLNAPGAVGRGGVPLGQAAGA